MKKYIKSTCVILLAIISHSLSAQLQTAGGSVYTQGAKISPEMAESVLK